MCTKCSKFVFSVWDNNNNSNNDSSQEKTLALCILLWETRLLSQPHRTPCRASPHHTTPHHNTPHHTTPHRTVPICCMYAVYRCGGVDTQLLLTIVVPQPETRCLSGMLIPTDLAVNWECRSWSAHAMHTKCKNGNPLNPSLGLLMTCNSLKFVRKGV